MNFLPINLVLEMPFYVQIAYFVLCLVLAIAGRKKIMGFWGYFFCSILLSPILGFLMLVISSDKK